MDSIIKNYEFVQDEDLNICENMGVAYQADMNADRVEYDEAYFQKYKSYEGSETEIKLNKGRCDFLKSNFNFDSNSRRLLDIGAGCGTFVEKAKSIGFDAKGFDVNESTVQYLKSKNLYDDDIGSSDIVTFWDSLEHIEDPSSVLNKISSSSIVLIAIPVFEDVKKIRESKHYRPGEHLYYWTETGFVDWMEKNGFKLLQKSNHEIEAGRESIGSFSFIKL